MATSLLSVAGLVGSPITIDTRTVRVVDIVARLSPTDTYPEVTGLVVRSGRATLFVAATHVDGLADRTGLRAAGTDLRDFSRRADDLLLAGDVLDRQVVDADGAHVIRAADLYLAVVGRTLRLVALDTSVGALLRRLAPRRLGAGRLGSSSIGAGAGSSRRVGPSWLGSAPAHPVPRRVIDWSDVALATAEPDVLTLTAPAVDVRRVHGRDLTAMLALEEHQDAAA